MRLMIFVLALVLGVFGAYAQTAPVAPKKDVTITLTQEELQALVNLLDLGVKAGGINTVPTAARVLGKLQAGMRANAPAPATPVTPGPKAEEKK